ncbi:contact-dependent growth inhibition system immunity protein [Actinomycetospora flava]|uniref:Contact-dependent growth inhibition system immunity protein n=1 Tax=Actinomycetospora flava TaxID=3129232 RepID=A0ABU8M220_9PSEU
MDIDPEALEWRELRTLFGAYLHQDLHEEHGSPQQAVQDFCRESTPAQLEDAADQVHRLLEITTDDASAEKATDAFYLAYAPEHDGLTMRGWLTELERTLRTGATARRDEPT